MPRPGSRRRIAAALLVATATGIFAAAPARAEKTDRDKPVNIESDSMTADETKKTATFEGKVVLTQGSLIIRADRIIVRQDTEGFQFGSATGRPATFRHKQDGTAGYIDGEAGRIEYDNKSDRVEFFNDARLRRDSGDDIRGDYISYDARTERFSVKSAEPTQTNRGRVVVTIVPKKTAPAPQSESDAAKKN